MFLFICVCCICVDSFYLNSVSTLIFIDLNYQLYWCNFVSFPAYSMLCCCCFFVKFSWPIYTLCISEYKIRLGGYCNLDVADCMSSCVSVCGPTAARYSCQPTGWWVSRISAWRWGASELWAIGGGATWKPAWLYSCTVSYTEMCVYTVCIYQTAVARSPGNEL